MVPVLRSTAAVAVADSLMQGVVYLAVVVGAAAGTIEDDDGERVEESVVLRYS